MTYTVTTNPTAFTGINITPNTNPSTSPTATNTTAMTTTPDTPILQVLPILHLIPLTNTESYRHYY